MKWKHKGQTIEFDVNSGTFYCSTLPGMESAPSLAAMKKRLDALSEKTFATFAVVRWKDFHYRTYKRASEDIAPEFETLDVVEIKDAGKRRYDGAKFVLSDGTQVGRVTLDTPENRAAMLALHVYEVETRRIEDERRTEHNILQGDINMQTPDEYNADGTRKENDADK